tara:strand:+ start:36000 stop:36341 length:342 start_codon:yes stop_codon:yes gene_type:complete
MAAVVTELLTEFGAAMTINRTTGESTDPVTFVVTPGTDTTLSPLGLIKPYSDAQIDGSLIQIGDRMIILDSPAGEPLLTDTITTDTDNWPIVSIKSVKPDDATAVVYFCQVRK